MKNTNPFFALIILVGISGWCSFCTNTGKPDKPPVVVTDTLSSWHCTPIAPLVEDRAVGMAGKFWPKGSTIKIGFVGGTEIQKGAVKASYARWKESANLNFEYPPTGPYNIRVAFAPGSAWSYIGTDCNSVSAQYPTLNFGFGGTAVIDHEAGHSLGCLHEQQIKGGVCWNEANVIADLSGPPNNWNIETIRFNVLDYHNPANIITNGYDQRSIMHYAIPARWTCNGLAINGGTEISVADRAFIAARYPYTQPPDPTNITISRADAAKITAQLEKVSASADKANVDAKAALSLAKSLLK